MSFLESCSRRHAIDAQYLTVEWERNRNSIGGNNAPVASEDRRDLKDKTVPHSHNHWLYSSTLMTTTYNSCSRNPTY